MAGTAVTKLTPEEKKHIIDEHLKIIVNRDENLVKLGYALKCDDRSCTLPDKVVVYFCPTRPCPPGTEEMPSRQ